jgi:hypothetical protein
VAFAQNRLRNSLNNRADLLEARGDEPNHRWTKGSGRGTADAPAALAAIKTSTPKRWTPTCPAADKWLIR